MKTEIKDKCVVAGLKIFKPANLKPLKVFHCSIMCFYSYSREMTGNEGRKTGNEVPGQCINLLAIRPPKFITFTLQKCAILVNTETTCQSKWSQNLPLK